MVRGRALRNTPLPETADFSRRDAEIAEQGISFSNTYFIFQRSLRLSVKLALRSSRHIVQSVITNVRPQEGVAIGCDVTDDHIIHKPGLQAV